MAFVEAACRLSGNWVVRLFIGDGVMKKKTPTDPRIRFGLRLKSLRAEIGMSQEALAHEADLARSYVGEVETGKRNISLLNICKLAAALNVEPADLL